MNQTIDFSYFSKLNKYFVKCLSRLEFFKNNCTNKNMKIVEPFHGCREIEISENNQ